jgi:predicted negative regulator of RcsB-dependent stress response
MQKSSVMQDPGAELIDRAQGLWAQFGQAILIGVVVIAAAAAGTVYWQQNQAKQENAASEKLAQANELFWRADYDRSRTIAQEVSKAYPGTPSGIDALRIAGDDAYWRGNWKDAIADYQAYLGKNSSGVVAAGVRRSLAYALESNKQYEEAAKNLDQLIGVFDRESSGELLFASARCLSAAGKNDEAKKRLQRILDEYPDASVQLQTRIELGRLSPQVLN